MVWCEEASPGTTQGAITDGLVEVIGVSCSYTRARRCIHGPGFLKRVDTWSSWQDLGRPQHFTKRDIRIYGQFMHYCLGV